MDNIASPDSTCCGGKKPACKTYTVVVVPNGASSGAGMGVVLSGTLNGAPWSAAGTTDGTGTYVYTMPSTGPYPVVTAATVTAPDAGASKGCAATLKFGASGDACKLTFSYCRKTVTAAYNPAAQPTLTTDDGNNAVGFTLVDDGRGTAVWDVCCLQVFIPFQTGCVESTRGVKFTATSKNKYYPSICKSVAVHCGTDAAIDLTQKLVSDCYLPGGGCPDFGCAAGPGPANRGFFPSSLVVTFSSKSGLLFANDEGVPITLLPTGLVRNSDGSYSCTGWSSGQRGGNGNHYNIPVSRCGPDNNQLYNYVNQPCNDPVGNCVRADAVATVVAISTFNGTVGIGYNRIFGPGDKVPDGTPIVTCGGGRTTYHEAGCIGKLVQVLGPPTTIEKAAGDCNTGATFGSLISLCAPVGGVLVFNDYNTQDQVTVKFADGCGSSNPYGGGGGGGVGGNPYDNPSASASVARSARRPGRGEPLDVDTLAALNPEFAAELAESRRQEADRLRLVEAARGCPHRIAPACNCATVPGRCSLGKGGEAGVTLLDCFNCRRDDAVTIESHLNGYTGYGIHAIAIGKELEALGVPVAFRAIERDDAGFIPLDEFAKRRAET